MFLTLGVQIDYDVVHLQTFLVQLFVLLQLNFQEVVQLIELRRFGGAPNGYPFAALADMLILNDAIGNLGLTEQPIKGRAFTWSNMHLDPLLEQLD
jgi:hypothetical protein